MGTGGGTMQMMAGTDSSRSVVSKRQRHCWPARQAAARPSPWGSFPCVLSAEREIDKEEGHPELQKADLAHKNSGSGCLSRRPAASSS